MRAKGKKLAGLFTALLLAFGLSACGAQSKTVVLTRQTEIVELKVTLTASDDVIQTLTQEATILKQKLPSTEEAEKVRVASKAAKEKFASIKGAKYTFAEDDTKFRESISVAVGDKAALKELTEKKLLPIKDGNQGDFLSLEKTVKNFEELGMKKVEK